MAKIEIDWINLFNEIKKPENQDFIKNTESFKKVGLLKILLDHGFSLEEVFDIDIPFQMTQVLNAFDGLDESAPDYELPDKKLLSSTSRETGFGKILGKYKCPENIAFALFNPNVGLSDQLAEKKPFQRLVDLTYSHD